MRAIILMSGGIDSTVILAQALKEGRECLAISFDYGQRHRLELRSAQNIARHYRVSHKIIKLDHSLMRGSSLTSEKDVENHRSFETIATAGIPSTYVPGRNTLFISYAISLAESTESQEIYLGINADDHAAYPDCRIAYVEAFQNLINLATKQAIEGKAPKLMTPLITKNKKEIYLLGHELEIPFNMTLSCYDPSPLKKHCGVCLACMLRKNAFLKAEIEDPTLYQN